MLFNRKDFVEEPELYRANCQNDMPGHGVVKICAGCHHHFFIGDSVKAGQTTIFDQFYCWSCGKKITRLDIEEASVMFQYM